MSDQIKSVHFIIFRWKQLAMVTGFYFIFVFIFALMGIHIIGGLDYFCTYRTVDENGNFRYVYTYILHIKELVGKYACS